MNIRYSLMPYSNFHPTDLPGWQFDHLIINRGSNKRTCMEKRGEEGVFGIEDKYYKEAYGRSYR
jgi:hypothetical protein